MKRLIMTSSLAVLLLAGCESVEKTSTLTSPVSGDVRTAGPGDTVMDFKSTRPLPNVFGKPDIFGRRTDAGRTTVRYVGNRGAIAVFERSDVAVESNATTMNQTPLIVPTVSKTTLSGTVGRTPVSGSASSTTYNVIGPRPTTSYAVAARPIQVTLANGQSMAIEGRKLTVLSVSAGSVEYRIK